MCKDSSRHAFLKALPKCEHHVHIEGTLMPDTLFRLLSRNNIKLPTDDPAFESEEALLKRYDEFTSLDDFLHYYYLGSRALIGPNDFEELAWAYFQRAANDGAAHTEISFDPQAHMERGVPFTAIVQGLTNARRRAETELGLSTEMICCFLRHMPVASALRMINSVDFKDAVAAKAIVGIGLDSSEVGFPPELFEEVYSVAKKHGLRLTAHAGEEGPAINLKTAISVLGCERIDHGIRVIDDPKLLHEIARTDTLLTVCPLSNVRLRCVQTLSDVPIKVFLEAGVKFSINSDDPAYFGGFLLANYCAVQEAFSLTPPEWKKIVKAGIEGSWCNTDRKKDLFKMLESTQIAI